MRRRNPFLLGEGKSPELQILAEQKVDLALAFAEDALVLERGRIAFRGKTAELREDDALQHRLLAIGEL